MGITEVEYETNLVQGQSKQGTAKIIVQYLLNDIKKKPRSFKIGIFSIFLVIGFLAAIQSAFQLSPVIFLSIAEDSVGDADVIITPQAFSNSTSGASGISSLRFLNSTRIGEICDSTEGVQGCAPRWILPVSLYNADVNSNNKLKFSSYAISIDSVLERSIGLGRRFTEDILEEGEGYLTATTVRGLGLEPGKNVTMNIDILNSFLRNSNFINADINSTDSAAEQYISEQLRLVLIDQIPYFTASDGTEAVITKDQIVTLSDVLVTLSGQANTTIGKDAIAFAVQQFMDSQGINGNAEDFVDPFIESGNLEEGAKSLNDLAKSLPDGFTFTASEVADAAAPLFLTALNVTDSYRVKSSVENPKGKWASALGNTLVIDSKKVLSRIWSAMSITIETGLDDPAFQNTSALARLIAQFYRSLGVRTMVSNTVANIDINQYALTSNVIFKNRINIYSSKNTISTNMVSITNKLTEQIQKSNNVQTSAPLSSTVNGLLILKMFLDNMIATSIFLLAMLAILLIYSLMISDIEEKTYEFGMLRALGFQKQSLIYLIIVQGLIFAIPGLVIGLIMAYLINTGISYIIFSRSITVTSYNLHYSAVVLAFCLGLFIPLISVYLPIQRAMSKTLRDSLDLYHRVVNEISVQVQKLEKLGVSFAQSMNAVILILMGVVCYYFAPAAFVYQDIALFLAIINIVLILMIIGFTLLLNLGQPLVEKLYVKLFLLFMPSSKHLEPIIYKNMDGHRRRNSKTALMYTVALSFLIFAGTGFNLQSKSISDNLKNTLGSDLKILLLNDITGLDEYRMSNYLKDYMKNNPDNILDFAFASIAIDKFPFLQKPRFSSLSTFPANRNLLLRGISENYLRSVYLDFYFPSTFDSSISFPKVNDEGVSGSTHIDTVYGLFTDEGTKPFDNSVDFYSVATNSDKRDQSIMGGGSPQNIEAEDNDFQSSQSSDAIPQISREKYKDQEILVIIPSGLKYISSVDVGTPCLIDIDSIRYRSKIRATAKKFPGFRFSSYRQVSFYGEILTGMEQFRFLIDSYYYYKGWDDTNEVLDFFSKVKENSSYGIPKSALTVKYKKVLTRDQREEIQNGLRNFFDSDLTQIFDVPAIIESIDETVFFIDLFSIVIAVISMILSFFLILISFVANIKENSWEFGVLRAIGLSKVQITRVYMIESCSLILASGTIGTIIGITVAITLTLQLLMFTELPFKFVFPYSMFFMTFFSGLAIAAGASYSALKDFKDKPVATIVKGLL